jgi:hypothetical protein
MPRVAKRSADKISGLDKAALEAEKAEEKKSAEKKRLELEKNLQQMKDEAEENRLSVLNDYLKENKGKPIKVTKPPPKKEKAMKFVGEESGKKALKNPKTPKTPKTPKSSSKAAKLSTSSSSSSKSNSSVSLLPKKLATFDEAQLSAYLQSELDISAGTVASFKKEKVNGKYLRGLWLHRNDEGMKLRIADIFQKIVPDDKDFALLIHLLSSNALRM